LDKLKSISEEQRSKMKILFVLAHPDDEATHLVYMKVLRDLGFPVHLLWLSYGDGSTDIQTKKKETMKVVATIGGVETTFLSHKVEELIRVFRSTPEEQKDAITGIMGEIRQSIEEAAFVIANAFEGGHLLHDFVNLMARSLAEIEGKELLEMPQYSLKTWEKIKESLRRAWENSQLGRHIFYNVGEFRDGGEAEQEMTLMTPQGEISMPSSLHLTNMALISKAGLIRQYQSQWEKVFSKLLEVVEFNGAEEYEYLRKARPIPELYDTIMHLQNVVKSWFGLAVHPKKLYQVKKIIEELAADIKAGNARQ
jgi:LmbE family N-acetylglucosaminyl deacetylase